MNNSFVSFVSILFPTDDTKEPVVKSGCKCSKSKCLKKYCECFLANKYCTDCNCTDCHNVPIFEIERSESYSSKRKIKTSGCNCSKTKCLKKYCECFASNLQCTELCNCVGCENCTTDDTLCASSATADTLCATADTFEPSQQSSSVARSTAPETSSSS